VFIQNWDPFAYLSSLTFTAIATTAAMSAAMMCGRHARQTTTHRSLKERPGSHQPSPQVGCQLLQLVFDTISEEPCSVSLVHPLFSARGKIKSFCPQAAVTTRLNATSPGARLISKLLKTFLGPLSTSSEMTWSIPEKSHLHCRFDRHRGNYFRP